MTANKLPLGGQLIKDLHLTECRVIPHYHDELERSEVCDWTFQVIGENVTSTEDSKGSISSLEIEKITNATYSFKNAFADNGITNDIIPFCLVTPATPR